MLAQTSSRPSLGIALLAASGLLLAASPALAQSAPNLSVSITPPGTTAVYSTGTYSVRVSNIGNRNASGVSLTINLPQTATSPQVYTMGNLMSYTTPTCALGGASGTVAGTRLVCSLGTIRRNQSASVSFSIQLPEKTGNLVLSATATTTTSPETNPANNSATVTANLSYYANAVPLDLDVENEHCTGTGLTAYFECAKFPSSISAHLSQFHDDGAGTRTISFPDEPTYGGSWSAAGTGLTFSITDSLGATVANFSGRGVPGGCFEGLTTFPGGSYVSPYRLCLAP